MFSTCKAVLCSESGYEQVSWENNVIQGKLTKHTPRKRTCGRSFWVVRALGFRAFRVELL